jgi:hypothetical protein
VVAVVMVVVVVQVRVLVIHRQSFVSSSFPLDMFQ